MEYRRLSTAVDEFNAFHVFMQSSEHLRSVQGFREGQLNVFLCKVVHILSYSPSRRLTPTNCCWYRKWDVWYRLFAFYWPSFCWSLCGKGRFSLMKTAAERVAEIRESADSINETALRCIFACTRGDLCSDTLTFSSRSESVNWAYQLPLVMRNTITEAKNNDTSMSNDIDS